MPNQKIPTPLTYVHWLLGLPMPAEEPEAIQVPVPTPVYMPNPRTIDESQLFGGDPMGGMGGPSLPPPIAPPPPPGMSGNGGGFYAPEGGAFG